MRLPRDAIFLPPLRLVAAGILLLFPSPSPAEDPDPQETAKRLAELLAGEREEAGLTLLEVRGAVAAVAAELAGQIAALPDERRLDRDEPPVREMLAAAGIPPVRVARMHVDLQLGAPRPADSALERWKGYGPGWRDAVDPAMDAVGIGGARGDDGWLVLVAILVDDLPDAGNLRELERKTVAMVNAARIEAGLAALEHSEPVARLARRHSEDMAARAYFSHRSRDGRDAAGRAREAGIPYRAISENIAQNRGMDDPVATAVESWLRSAGHRFNLMHPAMQLTGVGIAVDSDGMMFFTQVFLRPPGS